MPEKNAKKIMPEFSRSQFGLCANDGCENKRRTNIINSRFCQECSNKHKNAVEKPTRETLS